MMLFRGPIESRVMTVVKTNIKNAEKAHADHCEAVDAKLEVDIEALETGAEESKAQHLDATVNQLVGKLLG